MSETIPVKVVREIIADILIERRDAIMQDCEELSLESIERTGVCSEYSCEVGWTACGTGVLADDIREGIISLKEAVEDILTEEEIKQARARCKNYIAKSKEDEVER